jgi:hypothetical protein
MYICNDLNKIGKCKSAFEHNVLLELKNKVELSGSIYYNINIRVTELLLALIDNLNEIRLILDAVRSKQYKSEGVF